MFIRIIKFLFLFLLFIGPGAFALNFRESNEIAQKSNPQVMAKAERVKAVESQVRQAYSEFLPKLKVEGEYGKDYRTPVVYTVLPGTTFTLYPDEAANVTDYRAVISQNLFTGGKISSQLDIAWARLEIAKEELKRGKQELAYEAASAYYNILKAKKMLDLSIESFNFAKAHRDRVKIYFSLGGVPRADLLRAELRVTEEELYRIQAENELEVAKIEFNKVLGRNIEEPVELEDIEFGLYEISSPGSQELFATAFKYRPELRILNLQKRIGEREINLARSEYFPNLILTGSSSRNIADYPINAMNREVNSWNIYGLVSWTIFDGLKTPNRVGEAQAGLDLIRVYEKELENKIAAEAKEAQLYLRTARLKIQRSKKELEYAQESLGIAMKEYRIGIGKNIELLEAQNKLTKAKTDLLQSETDFELAKAKINLAAGKEIFVFY